jgi:hypothetical protein
VEQRGEVRAIARQEYWCDVTGAGEERLIKREEDVLGILQ